MNLSRLALACAAGIVCGACTADASALGRTYFVGGDTQATFTTGTYAGQANPNYNRLTFLYAHYIQPGTSDHFHAIGTYALSGPGGNPVVESKGTNYWLPESYQRNTPGGQNYIPLLPGSGAFSGVFRSGLDSDTYSDLGIYSVKSLENSPNLEEIDMWNAASSARRKSDLTGATIALKLIDKSADLVVADGSGNAIVSNPGDTFIIGSGNNINFTPLFWAAGTTPVNTPLFAQFRLVDLGTGAGYTPFGESGLFQYDFQVVPEPGSMVALGAGLLGMAGLIRRKK